MRAAFIRTLADLASQDDRIVLLTGDLGFNAIEPFAERYASRFYNVGVAEQNMVGIATGLAEDGFLPFVYSIATFATLRPFEFFRNGAVLQQLPVRVVGVGGGFEYGNNGASHHALEDLAVMRTQPGLSVIAPADAEQTAAALRETWQVPGSVYYRLGKNDTTRVPGLQGQFSFGRLAVLSQGSDVAVIAVGSISGEGAQATEMLQAQGIRTTFAVLSTLSPPPVEDLTNLLRGIPLVLTVEAHYVTGGLGSLVAEVIAEAGMSCRLVRCGVGDTTDGVSGSESFMNHRHGLSAACISERVLAELAPPVST